MCECGSGGPLLNCFRYHGPVPNVDNGEYDLVVLVDGVCRAYKHCKLCGNMWYWDEDENSYLKLVSGVNVQYMTVADYREYISVYNSVEWMGVSVGVS